MPHPLPSPRFLVDRVVALVQVLDERLERGFRVAVLQRVDDLLVLGDDLLEHGRRRREPSLATRMKPRSWLSRL